MKAVFSKHEYTCTVEQISNEDKKKVFANTKHYIKGYCLIFSSMAVVLIIPLFFFNLTNEALLKDTLIVICCLLFVVFLTTSFLLLQAKIGLREKYKLVEKGVVTKQDTGGDSESMNYTYIGSNKYPLLPSNIVVGDRVSIEHTLTKKNKKNLFIQVEKI